MSAITVSPVGITSDVLPAAIERIRAAFAAFGGPIVAAETVGIADAELQFARPRRRVEFVGRATISQLA